jgi:hypothetical protein
MSAIARCLGLQKLDGHFKKSVSFKKARIAGAVSAASFGGISPSSLLFGDDMA